MSRPLPGDREYEDGRSRIAIFLIMLGKSGGAGIKRGL
jgi:hypothetical protein